MKYLEAQPIWLVHLAVAPWRGILCSGGLCKRLLGGASRVGDGRARMEKRRSLEFCIRVAEKKQKMKGCRVTSAVEMWKASVGVGVKRGGERSAMNGEVSN